MTTEYHKIDSIFKRDPATKHRTFLDGQWTRPAFEYLANNQWDFLEKVDGTNMRVIIDRIGNMSIAGRTDRAQLQQPLLGNMMEQFEPLIPKINEMFPNGVVIYGEGYGAKIQKGGGNYGEEQKFVTFDIMTMQGVYLAYEKVLDITDMLGIDVVPHIGRGTLYDGIEMCKAGFKSQWGEFDAFQAEGLIARLPMELFDNNGKRIITKIKIKDFIG